MEKEKTKENRKTTKGENKFQGWYKLKKKRWGGCSVLQQVRNPNLTTPTVIQNNIHTKRKISTSRSTSLPRTRYTWSPKPSSIFRSSIPHNSFPQKKTILIHISKSNWLCGLRQITCPAFTFFFQENIVYYFFVYSHINQFPFYQVFFLKSFLF